MTSKLTGVPVNELTTEERQRLVTMEDRLHKRAIDHDGAVSDAVRLARAGLREGCRPIATCLFLKPTGKRLIKSELVALSHLPMRCSRIFICITCYASVASSMDLIMQNRSIARYHPVP